MDFIPIILSSIRKNPDQTGEKYIYRYDNVLCECNECRVKVLNLDIINYSEYDICPNCNGSNTFNIEYEKIEGALLRINKHDTKHKWNGGDICLKCNCIKKDEYDAKNFINKKFRSYSIDEGKTWIFRAPKCLNNKL